MPRASTNKLNQEKVSIIIPFFNREDFLAEAIESVLAQTYQNWELILIDDGSTDSGSQIAENFVKKYPGQIFLYTHENRINRGASSSRNLGIKQAEGDFITFLDSDDVFLPSALAVEIENFSQHPEADAVCGTLQYWFSWTNRQDKKERDFLVNLGLPTEKLYQPPDLLVHNLRAGGRKPGMGCAILKSEFIKKHQLFEDDFRYVSEDQIFWARMSLYAKIYVIRDCLTKYRQHPHSSVALSVKSEHVNTNQKKFLDWLENFLTENNIENGDVRHALKAWQKELSYRDKHQWLIDVYQRILPFHIRYRIRDLIISWRARN